ncbi:MAG: hypothetical protein Q3965_02510 [Rothia sp. (in: high G+C Gram-positive bacteria)]|nr:hypothetical protein [Rothia sp. (in: high G+C Gram-positive bacteria)]
MARQVLLDKKPYRRMRLAIATCLFAVLAFTLPLFLPALLHHGSSYGLEQEAGGDMQIGASPYEESQQQSCWRATTHTTENNVFGASVFTVRYGFDWCRSGQGVELKSVNSWVQQRILGNWELGELSWSEIKNQSSTRGGQTLHVTQQMSYSTATASGSSSRCFIVDFTEEGEAKAQRC